MHLQPLLVLSLNILLSSATLCTQDNCYRALSNKLPTASFFCSTYTKTTNTATTSLPTYATACSDVPSKISSACSCLLTTSTTSKTSTTLSTSKTSTTSTTNKTSSTTPTVAATCVPSKLQNPLFNLNADYQAPPWTYSIYQDPAQSSPPDVQYVQEPSFGFTALFDSPFSLLPFLYPLICSFDFQGK